MKTINSPRWPCLKLKGLEVFNTTADQRYLLGEKVFLRTHFPIQMRRYQNAQSLRVFTEMDLLKDVINQEGVSPGNRIFFLYGAAGAGKSELLRWLQASITHQAPKRAKHMVRINRNELDVLSIVEKFHVLLSNTFFSQTAHRRWEDARKKPRTVAKLILLSALEKTFESDEVINSLYYRLLEWIQPRVERALAIEKVGEEYNTPIELISQEDLVELQAESIFPIQIEYEQFRFHLDKAFQDLLLEGSSLPGTLQQISDQLALSKTRPILLIDDLVQSLSIFSTDLLDYFITLDEGNWDVVIGLTPNALSDQDRGRRLLDRITYLDTFDDRVVKLFLSDTRGDESYFLNNENCSAFLAPYLDMLRSINGRPCRKCRFQKKCNKVFGREGKIILAPFNKPLLQRIFANLPDGKGKARQFLRVMREILDTAISTGQMDTSLNGRVKIDMAAESPIKSLSTLVESYYPPITQPQEHKIDLDFLSAFNFARKSSWVRLQPLKLQMTSASSFVSNITLQEDTSNIVVKDWLDGKPVNRQSLQLLRRGTARWIRDSFSVGYIHRPNKPKAHRILRWNGIYMDVRPPVLLEGIDDEIGISLSPSIGMLAFHLSEYASATGVHRNNLARLIASNPNTHHIINQALSFQSKLELSLSEQLKDHPSRFSAELIALFWMLGDMQHLEGNPLLMPLPISSSVGSNVQASTKVLEYAQLLFEDFFMLREQLYDYDRFHQSLANSSLEEISGKFLNLDTNKIAAEFMVGNLLLSEYIARVQQRILVWKNPLLSSDLSFVHKTLIRSFSEYGSVGLPFASIPSNVWESIRRDNPEVFQKLRIYLDLDVSRQAQ